jgi:hypothetical protein
MIYNLIKFNYANQTKNTIPLDFHPKGFCCVNDDIYFIHNNGICKKSEDGFEFDWCFTLTCASVPDLSQLSSISYCEKSNSLYVVGAGGSQLYKIDLTMLEFEDLISSDSARRFKDQYLSTDKSPTYVVSNGREVFWSVRDCHRCFKVSGEKALPLVGCGRSGFSMSNLKCSKICHPTGMAIMEQTVFFADSGNNRLRGIKGDSTFSIIDDCKNLRDVFYDSKKLFFLSDNTVHMLSSEGDKTHLFEVYKVECEIQSFCPTGKDCLYILEKNHASTSEKTERN